MMNEKGLESLEVGSHYIHEDYQNRMMTVTINRRGEYVGVLDNGCIIGLENWDVNHMIFVRKGGK